MPVAGACAATHCELWDATDVVTGRAVATGTGTTAVAVAAGAGAAVAAGAGVAKGAPCSVGVQDGHARQTRDVAFTKALSRSNSRTS